MATKRVLPINSIESVGAGKTAIIKPPTNVRYHGIELFYQTDTTNGATKANMEAEIGDIEIILEGVTQRKFNAQQLFDINETKGRAARDGSATKMGALPIFFTEMQRKSQIEKESGAWGMAGVSPEGFRIEVPIVDASQAAQLKAVAWVDDVQEAPVGITKWRRNTISVAATGQLDYLISTKQGNSLQGLYLFEGTAGDIDDFNLTWDGLPIGDLTEDQLEAVLKDFTDYTYLSGLKHIPLDFNHPADVLRTVKSVNGSRVPVQEVLLTLNMAAAANVTMITEEVGAPY